MRTSEVFTFYKKLGEGFEKPSMFSALPGAFIQERREVPLRKVTCQPLTNVYLRLGSFELQRDFSKSICRP